MVKLDERPPAKVTGASKDLPPMAIDYSRIRMPEPHTSLVRPPDERSMFDRLLSNRLRREFAITFGAGLLALVLVALVLAERSNLQRTAFDERTPASGQVSPDRSTGGFEVDPAADPDSHQGTHMVVPPNDAEPRRALPPIAVETSTTSLATTTLATGETTAGASTTTQSTLQTTSNSPTTEQTSTTSTTSTTAASSTTLHPNVGEPYVELAIPGRIQSEHFDTDGQGEAYNDLDPGNDGLAARRKHGVDIYQSEGGPVYVGSTHQGEWLEYTVTVSRTAGYVATISVSAAGEDPGAVGVHIDGERFSRFDVSPTGANSKFVQLTSAPQMIETGTRVVRLSIRDGGDLNINWIAFEEVG